MSWYYKTRYIWYGVDDVSVTWWAGRAVDIGSSVAGWCGDRSLMRGSNIREEDISASSLRERLKKTNRAAARSSRIFDYLCDIVIYTWRRRKKERKVMWRELSTHHRASQRETPTETCETWLAGKSGNTNNHTSMLFWPPSSQFLKAFFFTTKVNTLFVIQVATL